MPAHRTTVFTGRVITADPQRPAARAVVVRDGRIAELLDHVPEHGERVDAPWILPGFTDSHVHFPSWAIGLRELRLFDAGSAAEVVERVAQAPGEGWLRGRGWREEKWTDSPTRAALDAVTDRPVALRSHDGHSMWLNSAALAVAEDLERPGGMVDRELGILREESAWYFEAAYAAPPRDEVRAAILDALEVTAGRGVVAIHDKDGGRGATELLGDHGGRLKVWQSVPPELMDHPRADYVKTFMDGTLGSRTARLLDGSGVQISSTEDLAQVIREAARRHLPVAVHAIGDLANREALDAFEQTRRLWEPLGLRHRIEHAQCVHPDDQPRFARLNVTASVQYSHAISDREIAARLWADRLGHAYPYRQLLDHGARLAAGSDAPVEELDPLAGLLAARECGLAADEALASFTTAPAHLEKAERGRIAPGLPADLVLLDANPLEGPATVRATFIDGIAVMPH
jgi:predicted amidohydrolase YtcJ